MSERESGRGIPLTWIWAALPAALILGALGVTPLRSWDFWWHAAIGRIIDVTGEVPAENMFLYTMDAGHPSFIQPWLSQWLLFRLEDVAGLNVVLLVRNLLAGGAWAGLTWWAHQRAQSWQLAAVLTLLALPFGYLYIGARTHLFVWPLFIGCVALAYVVRAGRLNRFWLLSLPAIAAVWVNLHGSFVLPALVALAFLADRVWNRAIGEEDADLSMWLFALVGVLAASAANPRGLEVWTYLIELSSNQVIQNTITEWMPVTLGRPPTLGPLFYALLLGGSAVFAAGREEFELVDALLFYGFGLLAALHARSLLWFALVLPVALAPCAGAVMRRVGESDTPEPPTRIASIIHGVVVAMMVVGALAMQPWGENHEVALKFRTDVRAKSPMAGLVPADVPVDAIWLLKALPPEKLRLFHDHRSPGYIIYQLQDAEPSQMVFVDNRVELPPAALWSEFERAGDATDWRATFEDYDINAAVLMNEEQSRLVAEMEDSDDWRRLYRAETYSVFMERSFADSNLRR